MKNALLTVTICTVLTACGGGNNNQGGFWSRVNPFNWFGKQEVQTISPSVTVRDDRKLVAQVQDLKVEQVPGGAIVHAKGLADRQGYYDAGLVPQKPEENLKNGKLVLEFRVKPPIDPTQISTKRSREILVARFISSQALEGINSVSVIASQNRRTVRRQN